MDTRARLTTSALTFSLVLAALAAACGPPPPAVEAVSPSATPTAPAPSAAPSTEPSAASSAAPSATPSAAPIALPPGMPAVSVPISATRFADELKKLGFDSKKPIVDLERMDTKAKKKLMPLFQKALGYEACTGCHAAEGDYDTTTRNMKITRKMWSQFVAAVRDDKGGLVFCDSCHNGGTKILNRTDRKAIGKFMHENYVDKLVRADKQDNGCAACHGSPLQPAIIEKLWGIAAR